MWLIWLFIAQAAATLVSVRVHGEIGIRLNRDNDPIILKTGSRILVRVCLVLGWSYELQEFPHTSRCAVLTHDCRCYNWKNTASGQQCVDIWLTKTVTLQWTLVPLHNVLALPAPGALQFGILRKRWHDYPITNFTANYCALAQRLPRPLLDVISHTIIVDTFTPSVEAENPLAVVGVLIVAYAIFVLWISVCAEDTAKNIVSYQKA